MTKNDKSVWVRFGTIMLIVYVLLLLLLAHRQQDKIDALERCFKVNQTNSEYCLDDKNLSNYRN